MRKPSQVIGEALGLYDHSSQFLCHIIEDHFPRVEAQAAKDCILDKFPDNISLGSHMMKYEPLYATIRNDGDLTDSEKELILYNLKRAWFINLVLELEGKGE